MHDSKTGTKQKASLLMMGAAYQAKALQLLECTRQAAASRTHKNRNPTLISRCNSGRSLWSQAADRPSMLHPKRVSTGQLRWQDWFVTYQASSRLDLMAGQAVLYPVQHCSMCIMRGLYGLTQPFLTFCNLL